MIDYTLSDRQQAVLEYAAAREGQKPDAYLATRLDKLFTDLATDAAFLARQEAVSMAQTLLDLGKAVSVTADPVTRFPIVTEQK